MLMLKVEEFHFREPILDKTEYRLLKNDIIGILSESKTRYSDNAKDIITAVFMKLTQPEELGEYDSFMLIVNFIYRTLEKLKQLDQDYDCVINDFVNNTGKAYLFKAEAVNERQKTIGVSQTEQFV